MASEIPPAAAPLPYKVGNEKLVKVSDSASARLRSLLQKQGRPGGALRVAVIGGGCSGLQYKMDLVDGPAPRDILVASNSVNVVVDPKSALFVSGSVLDFSDDLQKGRVQGDESERRCALFLRREFLRMNGAEAFELLGIEPRPRIAPDVIAEAFRARAREQHPDAGGEASGFQQLNAARRILENPSQRLEALAQILRDAGGGQVVNPEAGIGSFSSQPDPEFTAISFSAAAILQEIKSLSTKPRAGAGLIAVMESARCLAQLHRLEAVEDGLQKIQERLDVSLDSLDQAWTGRSSADRIGLHSEIESQRARILALNKLADNLRAARTELEILRNLPAK